MGKAAPRAAVSAVVDVRGEVDVFVHPAVAVVVQLVAHRVVVGRGHAVVLASQRVRVQGVVLHAVLVVGEAADEDAVALLAAHLGVGQPAVVSALAAVARVLVEVDVLVHLAVAVVVQAVAGLGPVGVGAAGVVLHAVGKQVLAGRAPVGPVGRLVVDHVPRIHPFAVDTVGNIGSVAVGLLVNLVRAVALLLRVVRGAVAHALGIRVAARHRQSKSKNKSQQHHRMIILHG
jgi:hypothetical protein